MRNNPFSSPSWVGAYLIFGCLGLLFFSEPLLKQRPRQFEVVSSGSSLQTSIPVNKALLELKSNKAFSLEELLAKTQRPNGKLLVNFWATWCEPCIEEVPTLATLAGQLQNQSDPSLPTLVTISVDEKAEAVRKFEKTLSRPLPFLVLHDPDGSFSRQLGVTKFPETFLIDSKGKILQKWIGPQDWLSLEVLQTLKKSCT
ncbi:MAG: TlpA family protein disulfide reductase [Proteobacteria bacterium]|nr:TlpA family protein disulfide reductase [Pseudomonadota bacterium]